MQNSVDEEKAIMSLIYLPVWQRPDKQSFLLPIKDLHIDHQTSFEFSPGTLVVSSDAGSQWLSNSTYSGHKDTTTFAAAAGFNVLIFAGK